MFNQLTIVAPGLLGASVAMAAKKRGLARKVSVYARREAVVEQLKSASWCDTAFTSLEDACCGSDFIILCAPVDKIISLAETLAKTDCLTGLPIVTDVGSVKGEISRRCESALNGKAIFVGSHPMAGSEKTGLENACEDLFEKRSCFVTPLPSTDVEATAKVVDFWKSLGSTVIVETPDAHDETVAKISHLPHVISAALASFIGNQCPNAIEACGNGLKDSTRIAAGDPGLWSEIIGQNRQEILSSIEEFQNHLQKFHSAIATESDLEVLKFLTEGKQFRDRL